MKGKTKLMGSKFKYFFFFARILEQYRTVGKLETTTLKEPVSCRHTSQLLLSVPYGYPSGFMSYIEDTWEKAFKDVKSICAKFCRMLFPPV